MASFQNFRSALNGFNREDVVRYIEYINNQHNAQVNQLNTEIQALRTELDTCRKNAQDAQAISAQLEAALQKNEQVEKELAEAYVQLEQAAARPQTDSELEAYRRAERTERIANERVAQMYDQANGILADATVHADEAASQVGTLADQVCAQLTQLQAAIASGANTLRDTAAALYAIKPAAQEE